MLINRKALFTLVMCIGAALACNVPDGTEDTPSAVEAVYATITAQANSTPVPDDSPTGVPAAIEGTSTPDETPTPTLTPTPPDERTENGKNLSIQRCTSTIVVDGNGNDWDAQSQLTSIALTHNTYGQNDWQGINDLSAQARLCWIHSNLYLHIMVTDDIHVQNETGRDAWKGDEVEVFFDSDLRGDFFEEVWNADDVQLGLSPGDFDENPEAVIQYQPRNRLAAGVVLAARPEIGAGGNYVLEAAIPWSVFGITPATNTGYGFCLALSDNDQVDSAQQDSMASHCSSLFVSDPTTWVTITLIP